MSTGLRRFNASRPRCGYTSLASSPISAAKARHSGSVTSTCHGYDSHDGQSKPANLAQRDDELSTASTRLVRASSDRRGCARAASHWLESGECQSTLQGVLLRGTKHPSPCFSSPRNPPSRSRAFSASTAKRHRFPHQQPSDIVSVARKSVTIAR